MHDFNYIYSLSIQRELHFKVTHANRIYMYVYKCNNILRLEWAALYENLRIDKQRIDKSTECKIIPD